MKKDRQKTKSCSTFTWRCQFFHNVTQAKRLEAMYKVDEYKEYFDRFHVSYRVFNPKDLPEVWWSDKPRRAEGSWKAQYKGNRQYARG